MDTFSEYHPLINFVYFALVIGISMFYMHPVLLALSLAAVMLASLAGCSTQTQSEPASPPASSAAEAAQESSAAETTAQTPEDAEETGGDITREELEQLERLGAAAAILGKSLYTGALDLAECLERLGRGK